MYYAYKSTSPSNMVRKFHLLAINDISGPKLRVPISTTMKVEMPKSKLPAMDRLINYPKHTIDPSQLSESILTCSRVHLSQLEGEDADDEKLNQLAQTIRHSNAGHINDLFSDSIQNCDFNLNDNSTHVTARLSLKQLWEEACADADNIGPDGVSELEKHLILFRKNCNKQNSSKVNSTKGCTDTESSGKTIPMTRGVYKGNIDRVFNTHHM